MQIKSAKNVVYKVTWWCRTHRRSIEGFSLLRPQVPLLAIGGAESL